MEQLKLLHKMLQMHLEILRHSTAHLMAQAVKRLYKNAKFGVGPVIEGGFYYDIDLEESLTPEDLVGN